MKPASCACFTIVENGLSSVPNALNRYDSVPEKMPSTEMMRSPVSFKCLSVAKMGRPAPTVACSKRLHTSLAL